MKSSSLKKTETFVSKTLKRNKWKLHHQRCSFNQITQSQSCSHRRTSQRYSSQHCTECLCMVADSDKLYHLGRCTCCWPSSFLRCSDLSNSSWHRQRNLSALECCKTFYFQVVGCRTDCSSFLISSFKETFKFAVGSCVNLEQLQLLFSFEITFARLDVVVLQSFGDNDWWADVQCNWLAQRNSVKLLVKTANKNA